LPKFEIHWKFVANLTPHQAATAVVLLQHRVPELADCGSEITDNREPPNRIKLIAERELEGPEAALAWADLIQGKVIDSRAISCLRPEYRMVISAPDKPAPKEVPCPSSG